MSENEQNVQDQNVQDQNVQDQKQQRVMPDNYLVWAILTTIFCCLPFGIAGIVNASKVSSLWAIGHYDEAQRASQQAKKWTIVAAICGVVLWIVNILIYAITGAALLGSIGNSYPY